MSSMSSWYSDKKRLFSARSDASIARSDTSMASEKDASSSDVVVLASEFDESRINADKQNADK